MGCGACMSAGGDCNASCPARADDDDPNDGGGEASCTGAGIDWLYDPPRVGWPGDGAATAGEGSVIRYTGLLEAAWTPMARDADAADEDEDEAATPLPATAPPGDMRPRLCECGSAER